MSRAPHLADDELVDALEGTLADVRAGHIAACPVCAAQLDDLRAIAARAAGSTPSRRSMNSVSPRCEVIGRSPAGSV